MDARRDAVQQAVGFAMKSVTQVVDDRVRENVLQFSRAFIEKYDILEEKQDRNRWRVTIKAWVRRENLLKGLLQKDPDKSVIDGAGLLTAALTNEQRVKEAAEILTDILTSLSYENYVHAAVGAEGINARSGELTLNVRFTFDKERYITQMVPQIASVLDYVAEAKQKDTPFLLSRASDGDTVVVTPPTEFDSLSSYMAPMEIKKENRYIDLPGVSGFANIYLLKKNYYFDCYRVPAEAFAAVLESLLLKGGQNRLTGKMFDEAELKIAFKSKNGQLIREHKEPLQLYNVMLFTNLDALKRSPWSVGKPEQYNEQRHALFILPRLGTIAGNVANATDYLLIEEDAASISVKMSQKDIKLVENAECRIEMKR
ncbi:hypothetical protein FACS1894204_11760 [Synergistales bacterium]|nr:hypothetical protein FACS1894204_11760 [Synergistales bacterium]